MRSETKRKIMKLIAARKEFCKKTSEFSRVANKSLDCVEELVSIFNKNNDVTNIVSKIYEENKTYAKYFILKKFKNNLYIKVDIYHNKYENMECYNRIELLQYTNDTTKKIMRIEFVVDDIKIKIDKDEKLILKIEDIDKFNENNISAYIADEKLICDVASISKKLIEIYHDVHAEMLEILFKIRESECKEILKSVRE
jgi:hypothetical protein